MLGNSDIDVLDFQPSGGRILEVVQLGSLCAADRRYDLRPMVEVFFGQGEPQTAGGADQEDGGVRSFRGHRHTFCWLRVLPAHAEQCQARLPLHSLHMTVRDTQDRLAGESPLHQLLCDLTDRTPRLFHRNQGTQPPSRYQAR